MSAKPIPYLIQGKNIIVVIGNKSHTISKDTHISYPKIVEALKNQDWESLTDLVEPKLAIVDFGAGNVAIKGNEIFWKGRPFHNSLATRMISMYQDGFPIDPMVRFMENLMENPSARSVNEFYGFVEKGGLPITSDGYILAFKKVKSDYYDCHSGTVLNKPAGLLTAKELAQMPAIGGRLKEVTVSLENGVTVVSMERNMVNDDKDQTCSEGLHFCSQEYLGHFSGSKVLILKINPRDVVSIPSDYNDTKGRCCRYEVVGEVNGDPALAFAQSINTEYAAKPVPAPAVNAQAAWPFPVSNDLDDGSEVKVSEVTEAADKVYSCVRVSSPYTVEYTDLTLQQARDQVAKNFRQKKANLMIVEKGTLAVVR